jgi:hypothetical protein
MISLEMYYDLVNAYDESMSSIRSFAISGIGANLHAKVVTQSTTDPNSSATTTLENIILDAKVQGTDINVFSSVEPTSQSQSAGGRYLLLMKKQHIHCAS